MTRRVFRIGDRVRVIDGPHAGDVAVIKSELAATHCVDHNPGLDCFCGVASLVHDLDLAPATDDYVVAAPPGWLELYRDDSRDAVPWSECLWQPAHLRKTVDA